MVDKKKYILIITVGLVILSSVAGVIFLKFKRQPSLIKPVITEEQKDSIEEPKLLTWEDPAGFSFAHPENIEIDPHEEDEENYAHLELTSPDHPGGIAIWLKDTDYTKIEDWADRESSDSGQVLDTELGGEPAKKIAYNEPKKLVTATLDVDALVLIEMTPDEEGYWQGIYEKIASSFTLIPLEGEDPLAPGPWEGTGGGGGIVEEAEEVIE